MAGEIDNMHFEMIDDQTVAALRAMGGTARLRMMNELCAAARALMAAHVRELHPDWSVLQIDAEVARRLRLVAA